MSATITELELRERLRDIAPVLAEEIIERFGLGWKDTLLEVLEWLEDYLPDRVMELISDD